MPFSIGHLQELMAEEDLDDLRERSQGGGDLRDDGGTGSGLLTAMERGWADANDMPGLSGPTTTMFQDIRGIAAEIGMPSRGQF